MTKKQALRGLSVEAHFYLAECCNCGEVMPSSKLIESRNYMDGDADCYCPHCNADDCDIADMGSAASEAWNYQQKRIEALLDELETKDKRIAELEAREFVVNLPAYVDGRTLGYGEVNHMIDLCADAIEKAGRAAGIITKVGE